MITHCYTNDCIFFRTRVLEKDEIALVWEIPLNLEGTKYKFVRISEFYITPLKTRQVSRHNIYLNIIKRSLGNPNHQVGCIMANPLTRFSLNGTGTKLF